MPLICKMPLSLLLERKNFPICISKYCSLFFFLSKRLKEDKDSLPLAVRYARLSRFQEIEVLTSGQVSEVPPRPVTIFLE